MTSLTTVPSARALYCVYEGLELEDEDKKV